MSEILSEIFVWVYLVGWIPAFLLIFRHIYLAGRLQHTRYVITDTEIAAFAILKSCFFATCWPVPAAFLAIRFFVRWLGKLLIRVMRLPSNGD